MQKENNSGVFSEKRNINQSSSSKRDVMAGARECKCVKQRTGIKICKAMQKVKRCYNKR